MGRSAPATVGLAPVGGIDPERIRLNRVVNFRSPDMPLALSAASPSEAPPLVWTRSHLGELSATNRLVVDVAARLIKAGARETLMPALQVWPPTHVVELFAHLPLKRARVLFGWLDGEQARVIAELDDAFRDVLLAEATVERLVQVVDALEPEEASRALGQLPKALRKRVLPQLQAHATITELGAFEAESAGSIMSRRFVVVPPDWTVGQTIEEIRAHAQTIERLYAVYVVDAERRPLGYPRLRDLLLQPATERVGDRIHTDFIGVGSETDQEEVARIADRYELSVVPVVDRAGRLIGRITPQRLDQVIRDEAAEDMKRMSGLPRDARPDESIGRIIRGRVPWLLLGLAGATLSAAVVGAFEDQLARATTWPPSSRSSCRAPAMPASRPPPWRCRGSRPASSPSPTWVGVWARSCSRR